MCISPFRKKNRDSQHEGFRFKTKVDHERQTRRIARQAQDDRRFGRPDGAGSRYQMRQNLAALGNDFWIENEHGQRTFKVDGKALRIRRTLIFEDALGSERCKIRERMPLVKGNIEIDGAYREQIAMVKALLIVKITGEPNLEVQENRLTHECTIGEGRQRSAEISKKRFSSATTAGSRSTPGKMMPSSWQWQCAAPKWHTEDSRHLTFECSKSSSGECLG